MDRSSGMRLQSRSPAGRGEPAPDPRSETGLRSPTPPGGAERTAQEQFLRELALHTDGIGGVQLWHCLARRGVWSYLAERGSAGESLQLLTQRFGAHLAYLNVVLRTLAVQGWLDAQPGSSVERSRVTLSSAGYELSRLFQDGISPGADAAQRVVSFLPVARQMARYLFGSHQPSPGVPELEALRDSNAGGWGLTRDPRVDVGVAERLRLALEGNLLGPIVVALQDEFYPGVLGSCLERAPRAWRVPGVAAWARRAQRAQLFDTFENTPWLDVSRLQGNRQRLGVAFQLLADAGWVELDKSRARLTSKGKYAARRAWAYGVPVSYLPLFGRLDELLFGEHRRVLGQVPGRSEVHVDRRLNVKASGATHGRYFAAADELVLAAFNRPFSEQPRGFADMGCGDGSWLEHIWQLIRERTLRGRLLRESPERPEYQVLMVGLDYHQAARRATRERLTRAGVPHLVSFGDINDPARLRDELSVSGVDSRELLHGSSFLIHNRPYQAPRDAAQAARRTSVPAGAYAAAGVAIEPAALMQNLVEFFASWRQIIGPHGMLVIELHDPERVVVGKTLTNYMLTHGLSDQLTVGVEPFLSAAREAGLVAAPEHQRLFPPQRELATVSVNHFRRA